MSKCLKIITNYGKQSAWRNSKIMKYNLNKEKI